MVVRQYAIVPRRREGQQQLSLDAVAERVGMHPSLVERFVECGLIEPSGWEGARLVFDASAVPRLRMIGRLRENLSVNLAGIEVVLNLLDRFRALQRENDSLRSRLYR
jgi:MerR family transcriptional regulator, heat shock protein HspR